MKTLALFDFDGTLTRNDTLLAFLRYVHPGFSWLFPLAFAMPAIILWKMGLRSNDAAKLALVRWAFQRIKPEWLATLGERFANECVDAFLRPAAWQTLQAHRKAGHRIVVVSASLDTWLAPWAERHGLELLCTNIKRAADGTLTLQPANCYGPEKARRVCELLNLTHYSTVYAYGDSRGDSELLALATHPFYRTFPESIHK